MTTTMDKFSFLSNSDPSSIEQLYRQYLADPGSVDPSWQDFFKGFDFARTNFAETAEKPEVLDKEFRVLNLIDDYRKRGHFFTKTNPVRTRRSYTPTLDLENYGLADSDLDSLFHAGKSIGIGLASLRDIQAHLMQTYCRSVGAEFMYIRDVAKTNWLLAYMESTRNTPDYKPDEKKGIYHHLKTAVGFEKFIHKKFVGQKRFSLEGAETLIPALHSAIQRGVELGIEDFVIGMAHRGRLNVLANVMKKPNEDIFREFTANAYEGSISLGDVKYHLGYDNIIAVGDQKKAKLKLAPNPSHLETVSPIIQGISRALIEHEYEQNYNRVCPVLIHGDAAVAAQGVVYEVIQMMDLEGYKTGGTIHLVINNQVGFTTNYLEARSSTYCTDVGKTTKSPVFHVNGDDAEAVVFTLRMAMEYRQQFHSDVFIDILCYRKYGHNEGDEPRFTQPTLYKAIAAHSNPRDIYAAKLVDEKVFSPEDISKLEESYDNYLEEKLELARQDRKIHIKQFLGDRWSSYQYSSSEDFLQSPFTGVKKKDLLRIADRINHLPGEMSFFNKTIKLVEERKKLISEGKVDWAMGELLAYGTLVDSGFPVRLSGQDSVRGTFSHRHAGHTIEDTDMRYFPLQHVSAKQASFTGLNSLLSEYGVLGFEYGYSLTAPQGLTIWEAQFGDFHNVAQVIIDQYISSAEEKWGLMNGIVLFLPHGYEGQGPEHSSARIERFLVLAANNNMQLVNCTTPANLFHLLRRQVTRNFRTPLVVFTPKSLLRHPRVVSSIESLVDGRFQEVIDDENVDVEEVKRVVFCSGKIYYDLLAKKEEYNARDIALVRIEQLHPFPKEQIDDIIARYSKALVHLWVQEEPENMGPWTYMNYRFRDIPIIHITRQASGSPAVGLHEIHHLEQDEIVYKVFRHCDCDLKHKYCGLQCLVGKSRREILKQFNYIFMDRTINLK
jgi:2-oxoglutarate dehydrogenase E1 component